jgi:F-type H+-transporting ATPase subunit delta
MKNTVLAKRYAKALFAVAKEEDAFDDYANALNSLADIFRTVPEVEDALVNPVYPAEVRDKVMAYIVQSMDASPIMRNFLLLVVRKKRSAVLPEIAEAFQALVDERRNICQGTVVSAIELNEGLKQKVQKMLEKLTGKTVVLTAEVDSDIIGGIIAKVGDLVLDGSIKTQLTGLKESIKGSNS